MILYLGVERGIKINNKSPFENQGLSLLKDKGWLGAALLLCLVQWAGIVGYHSAMISVMSKSLDW